MWTTSKNNTSKAVKLTRGSHSIFANYGSALANYGDAVAYCVSHLGTDLRSYSDLGVGLLHLPPPAPVGLTVL